MAPRRPGPFTLLARAARLSCPFCGQGELRRRWLTLRARCGVCGLSFDRDEREDYWLGAFLLNFIVTEVGFALLLLVVLVATSPRVPWSVIVAGGVVQIVVTPIVFYPFSRALWLAIDLIFRPPSAADFEGRPTHVDRLAS